MHSIFLNKNTIVFLAVLLVTIAIVFTISATSGNSKNSSDSTITNSDTIKDMRNLSPMQKSTFMKSESLGFSVGGAKDINNFRENIRNGFLPSVNSITYEGLFYDYYFDPGKSKDCSSMFCPSYSYAITDDPITKDREYYLSVGLNSNIKQSDFKRKKLNLMIVLDISGSMSSPLYNYYYDKTKNEKPGNVKDVYNTKLELATKTICNVLDQLDNGDRFGFVIFDDISELVIPMNNISKMNMKKIKEQILKLQPRGGTNMESGYVAALKQYGMDIDYNKKYYNEEGEDEEKIEDNNEKISFKIKDIEENRIIFITDAMPNTGNTSEQGLFGMFKKASGKKIYTSLIGIGVDFNTTLTESIMKIRGANYYSAKTNEEFKKRLDDEFDYMVTPLIFDLNMTFRSEGFEIEKVYGSPEADMSTNEIMNVNTLFPSDNKDGETRGGVIILKLKKKTGSPDITINVSYENRNGEKNSDDTKITFPKTNTESFDNRGIRKAVLLIRYANLVKEWMEKDYDINTTAGNNNLGRWEQQSKKLEVSEEYINVFKRFRKYFIQEMNYINDSKLKQEMEILKMLSEK